MGNTGLAERLEKAPGDRVFGKTPFRVPLHAKHEARRIWHRHRFDQAIRGPRLDAQPRGQAVDALAVQRVDLELRSQAQALEQPARRDANGVTRAVLHLQGCVLRFAVVKVARQLLHTLVQGAAKGHIQFLEPTANSKHRHTGGNRRLQQRQGQAIARAIMPGTLHAGGAIVMMRFDI